MRQMCLPVWWVFSPGPSLVPEVLGGQTHSASVVGLSPWLEYEFRVVAGNSIGVGEPSEPSELFRTKASGKEAADPPKLGGLDGLVFLGTPRSVPAPRSVKQPQGHRGGRLSSQERARWGWRQRRRHVRGGFPEADLRWPLLPHQQRI